MSTSPQHPLLAVVDQVEATHPDLGRLTAWCALVVKAQKCGIVVAPSGTGKSTALNAVARVSPGTIRIRSLTQAGLVPYEDPFTGFSGLVVLEDLAAMGTEYRRTFTTSTMADLVYEGYTEVHTGHQHISISNFAGSVLIGAQPVMMKGIVKDGIWEGTIQDKTLRYYHLYRPTAPAIGDADISLEWGIPLADVGPVDWANNAVRSLAQALSVQWGAGRTREHVADLLRASAALRESPEVETPDIITVATLCRPMTIERHIIDKQDLEGERRVRSDFLYLLIEFVSYGTFTLAQICDDYKVSPNTARRIMERYSRMWLEVDKSPTRYAPSAELQRIIEEVT